MKRSQVQSQNHDWTHDRFKAWEIQVQFFLVKMWSPGFPMCPISTNILTVLANFLSIQNSIFLKNIGHGCGNTRAASNTGMIFSSSWKVLFQIPLTMDNYLIKYLLHKKFSVFIIILPILKYLACILEPTNSRANYITLMKSKRTLCNYLQCLILFYNTLQCSLSLLQPFLTFSDAFRPFATFLNCITFSGTFHQTLFTWLVHHSFGFSGIISGQSALCFINVLHFSLLLQLYSCFLFPPLPNRTESAPFNHTTVYWPQISLHLLSS